MSSLAPTAPRVLVVIERDAPFTAAGLTSQPVAVAATAEIPIIYEQRSVSGSAPRRLDHDLSTPLPLHPVRLVAHALSTFVVVVVAGLAVIGIAPQLVGFDSVVVTSGSMEPAIRVADIVVTAPTDGQGLGPGAVVNIERGDRMVLHRVSSVGEHGYQTTGDANLVADSELVAPEDIRGVGVVVVPLIGLPRHWADEGEWLYLIATAAVVAAAMYMSRLRWALARRQEWSS